MTRNLITIHSPAFSTWAEFWSWCDRHQAKQVYLRRSAADGKYRGAISCAAPVTLRDDRKPRGCE